MLYFVFYYATCIITIYYINFMSKSFSFGSSPWTTFSKQSDSLMVDDFIKDKLFTFKTTHDASAGVMKFKQMVALEGSKLKREQQIKVWFPIWNDGSNIFLRFNRNYWKFLYENGLKDYSGRLINFYGGAQAERNFKNFVMKVGANWIGVNTSIDTRFRVLMQENAKLQVSSAHKINWNYQNWSFDFCNVINYHSASLFSNAFRVIYRMKDRQFFVKGQNKRLRTIKNVNLTDLNTYFTDFTLTYVQKLPSSTKLGLQTQLTKKGHTKSSVVLQKLVQWQKYPQFAPKIKAKLSTDRSVSLSLQSKIKGYGRWMVGWEVSKIGVEKGNINRLGLMIDINV